MARVAVRALVAGTVACFMTACVAGEIFTCLYMFSGFVQGLEFKLAQQFSRSGKMVKSLEFFFKAVASGLQVILSFGQILFNLDCTFAAIMKKALFLLFLKVFLKCIYAIIVLNNSCFLFSVLGLLYDESLYDSVVNIPTTAAPINGTVVPTTSS